MWLEFIAQPADAGGPLGYRRGTVGYHLPGQARHGKDGKRTSPGHYARSAGCLSASSPFGVQDCIIKKSRRFECAEVWSSKRWLGAWRDVHLPAHRSGVVCTSYKEDWHPYETHRTALELLRRLQGVVCCVTHTRRPWNQSGPGSASEVVSLVRTPQ